jgi:uncharacterized protein YndB with AHSA1/START domain
MHGPDGTDYSNHVQFRVVHPPERLEYTHGNDDDSEPIAFEVTVTFEEEAGGTRVTMLSVFPSAERRDFVVREHGAIEGGRQHLERLEAFARAMTE